MKAVTTRRLLPMCTVLVCAPAVAQVSSDASSAARALDLSVPAAPIEFPNPADYRNEPAGSWYDELYRRAREHDANGDWQVHGNAEVGVGWSSHGGNSNWQAANINMGKTYTTEDGDTGHVGLNISIGQFDGPAFAPGGHYGPAVPPMPMRFEPGPRGH